MARILQFNRVKPMIAIVPPLARGVRGTDDYGSGAFGAPRARITGGTAKEPCPCGGLADGHQDYAAVLHYAHMGIDFVTLPPEAVVMPASGESTRIGFAYAGDPRFGAIHFRPDEDPTLDLKVLYVASKDTVAGEAYAVGDVFGMSQDLRLRYPADARHHAGITPHVHVEIRDAYGIPLDFTTWIVQAETV